MCLSWSVKDMGFAVPVSWLGSKGQLRLYPSMSSPIILFVFRTCRRWRGKFYLEIKPRGISHLQNIQFTEHVRSMLHKHVFLDVFLRWTYIVILKECTQIRSSIQFEKSNEALLVLHFAFEPAALGSSVCCVYPLAECNHYLLSFFPVVRAISLVA